jgi:mediator of RNA polymerase II transcription subunit 18
VEFLTELGCRLEYEYAAKGFMFRKGRMKVTVSKIFKVVPTVPAPAPGSESLEALTQSHLVELSVLTTSNNDAIADDMKNFAEQLKPLVNLDKIDHRRTN